MAGPLIALGARVMFSTSGRGLAGALLRSVATGNNAEVDRKMRTAQAIALTRTVQSAQRELTGRIGRDFDQPVPFTRRAIGIETANRAKLRAAVFVRDAQARYLAPQIFGGRRPPKRFEQRLEGEAKRRPRVPGSAPGAGARLNASGNIPKATLLRLVKQATTKGSKLFVAPEGGPLAPGIYQRKGQRNVVPLLLFSRGAPTYRRRFDFFGVGVREIERAWPREFERAMRQIFD